MIKRILLSIASLFLLWQSAKFLFLIHHLEVESLPVLVLVAWVINMCITGIFAFAGFAHPTQKLLPDAYYKIRRPDSLKYWYRLLKVDLFRKFLLAIVWKNAEKQKGYFNGKRDGILNLETQSQKSEFGHLLPLIIITCIVAYLLSLNMVALGVFTMLWNLIGNLYPIILQRHHRMRIEQIRNRNQARG